MFKNQLLKGRHKIAQLADIKGELTRLWFVYLIVLVTIFSAILFAIVDFFEGYSALLIIDIVCLIFYIFAGILINFGKIVYPKYIVFVTAFLGIVIHASFLGISTGNSYLFFPLLCGIFIIFDINQKYSIVILICLVFSGIFFLYFTDYSMFMINTPSPLYTRYYTLTSFLISLIIIVMYIYTLIKSNNNYRNRLIQVNKNLKNSNKNLLKVNSELDSFVYKTSHDLRAPLSSLLGLLQIIRIEKDINQVSRYLDLSEKSVRKLDSFIIDILNISKNERQEIEINFINFKHNIEEILSQIEHLENCKNVKTNIRIDQTSDFYTDERRLNVVFNNLITNAISYADTSKKLSVLNINIDANAKEAIISFIDNGVGIKPEYIDKVSQMFFRGTLSGGGSGLGLYIVKETSKKLKGAVEISSEYGKWTHIKLVLPNLKSL